VDFLLVAMVLFLVVVKLMERFSRKEAVAAPTTRACPECLELVPLAARRCRACTASLPTV
jgi:large conductance mechanosensitive channel